MNEPNRIDEPNNEKKLNSINELTRQLDFIREAERLKSVLREAWTSTGRRESTAEHSWRLAVLAALLAPSFEVDMEKVLMMCLIHDLGELYVGDVSAASNPDEALKHAQEKRDVERVLSLLPETQGKALLALWQEYNDNSTPEAQLVKALDKAETIIQHNQGENPSDFDYGFNLAYGKQYFTSDPLLSSLRAILNNETAAYVRAAKSSV